MNRNILLLLLSIIAITPLLLIKKYIITNNNIYILFSLLLYATLMYLYIILFRTNEVSSNYIILQILQIFLVFIASYFMYNEEVSYMKMIGIFFGILCIILLY